MQNKTRICKMLYSSSFLSLIMETCLQCEKFTYVSEMLRMKICKPSCGTLWLIFHTHVYGTKLGVQHGIFFSYLCILLKISFKSLQAKRNRQVKKSFPIITSVPEVSLTPNVVFSFNIAVSRSFPHLATPSLF